MTVKCNNETMTAAKIRYLFILPMNIQALSLYTLCQETLSFTPREASRSFSSLINFTLVSGLKNKSKTYSCCIVINRVSTTIWRLFSTRQLCLLSVNVTHHTPFYVVIKHNILSLFHCRGGKKTRATSAFYIWESRVTTSEQPFSKQLFLRVLKNDRKYK